MSESYYFTRLVTCTGQKFGRSNVIKIFLVLLGTNFTKLGNYKDSFDLFVRKLLCVFVRFYIESRSNKFNLRVSTLPVLI